MNNAIKYVAAFLIFILIGVVSAMVVEQWIIHDTGTIVATYIQPYDETGILANETSIDWGTVVAGESYAIILKITNISPDTITVTVSADLTAYPYLTQTWSNDTFTNTVALLPTQSAIGDLTLTVDAAAPETAFTFDTIITVED